jgi:hypothetical protein
MSTKTENEVNVLHGGGVNPTIEQLKRQILELQNECQKLSSEIGAFKQEKQKEEKDSPRPPLQKKEKIKEKNHHHNSKMCWGKEPETHSQKGRKKAFVPPTLEEVQAYMDQKGENRFTALRFWNYYEARGWTLGKSKMRFWRRVLDIWINKENERSGRRNGSTSPAQQDNVVTFHAYKPIDTRGTVSYEEYLRMKGESSFTNHKA